jgi:hypothetical protein
MTMANTPTRGYPYPGDDDEFDPDNDIRALAEAVEKDVTALVEDTGWIDVTLLSGFTAGYEGARMRRKANVVYVQLMTVSPQQGTVAWGSEALVFQLPVGMRPKWSNWIIGNSAGQVLEVRVMNTGDVRFITPGKNVAVFSGSFPID